MSVSAVCHRRLTKRPGRRTGGPGQAFSRDSAISGGEALRSSLRPPICAVFEVLLLPDGNFGFQAVHGFHRSGKRRLPVGRRDHHNDARFADGHLSEPVDHREPADLMTMRQIRPEFRHRANRHFFVAVVFQAAHGLPVIVVPHDALKDDALAPSRSCRQHEKVPGGVDDLLRSTV